MVQYMKQVRRFGIISLAVKNLSMKNRNLLLNYFLGGCIVFVVFILVSILFKKWNLFDFNTRSLKNIIIEALIVSIVWSVVMFFSRNRLKNRQTDKN